MVADVPIPTHLPRWVCWRSWGGWPRRQVLGCPSRLGGPAILVTQTLSLPLWISLSPHLTRSESHWFSICVVLAMSFSVSIIFLSCPLAEPHSTRDLSSPAMDGSRTSCIGSAEFLTTGQPGRSLSHSVSDFLISCSLSLHSHWLLSCLPLPCFSSVSLVPFGGPPSLFS